MNQHYRPPRLAPTTNAAEGLLRRRFTVAEIDAMVEAGIVDEGERFELIGGEVVPMASKGYVHERLKNSLMLYWAQRLPGDVRFGLETTFRMSVDTFVGPDFVFWRTRDGIVSLKPATALLAVEVADSSLRWDLGRKAMVYAAHHVREVWVINARSLVTHVLLQPGPKGYAVKRRVGAKRELVPEFAPGLAVRLDILELV